MTPKKIPSTTHIAIIGLLAAGSIYMGAFDLRDTLTILASKSVTTARVVDSQVVPTRFGMSYDVHYLLSPGPGLPEVGRCDFLGRTNLWSSLPEQEWRAAVETKILQVRYDPNRPTINAPVISPPKVADSITPLAMGALFLFLVVGGLYVRLKNKTS